MRNIKADIKRLYHLPATIVAVTTCLCGLAGCDKYLDAKPDLKMVIPNKVSDYQALLDDNSVMNNNCPGLGEASADNYYMADADLSALTQQSQREVYTWGTDLYTGEFFPNDWAKAYNMVYQATLVTEGLAKISGDGQRADRDAVMGAALFFRGKALFEALTLWAVPYDRQTAATAAGIPLRPKADFNEPTTRATLAESVSQVMDDLKKSLGLLPQYPAHPMRPGRAAAFAMLARCCLYTADYTNALDYADSCLTYQSALLDYNQLAAGNQYPFGAYNIEVIFHSSMQTPALLAQQRCRADSVLFAQYSDGDIRKQAFFGAALGGGYNFKGNYNAQGGLFTGLAVDEILLVKAECECRAGNLGAAAAALNTLLEKRWDNTQFVPFVAGTAEETLRKILAERRKELAFRGLRWADLKRLNKVPGLATTLRRNVNGVAYTLPPNAPHYALPIPEDIIRLTGILQNAR